MDRTRALFNKIVVCALAMAGITSTSKLTAETHLIEDQAKVEKRVHANIRSFVKKYKGGCFTFISTGTLSSETTVDLFGLWVTAKTKETIQSGRALALAFTNAYLTDLKSHKDTYVYYEHDCKKWPKIYSSPLSLKNVQIRIAFWDEEVERPQAPYLAEIGFQHGKFIYYQADPQTQALTLVFEEAYDDAVKQVESTQVK